MVKINIIVVGKDKDWWVTDGIAHYEKLLSRYAKIKWTIVTAPVKSTKLSSEEIKIQEAKLLKKHLAGGTIISLTDKGRQFDSHKFSKKIESWLARSSGELRFVIGGPYGLDDSIIKSANDSISLSPFTFSHQIVRLVLLEQLYRAFSILHNTDYHK